MRVEDWRRERLLRCARSSKHLKGCSFWLQYRRKNHCGGCDQKWHKRLSDCDTLLFDMWMKAVGEFRLPCIFHMAGDLYCQGLSDSGFSHFFFSFCECHCVSLLIQSPLFSAYGVFSYKVYRSACLHIKKQENSQLYFFFFFWVIILFDRQHDLSSYGCLATTVTFSTFSWKKNLVLISGLPVKS